MPNSSTAGVDVESTVEIGTGLAYTVNTLDTAGILASLLVQGTLTAADYVSIDPHGGIELNGGTLSAPAVTVGNPAGLYGSGTVIGSITDYGGIGVDGSMVLDGNVAGVGGISLSSRQPSSLEFTAAATDNVFMTAGDLLQLDDPAAFTGSITIQPTVATSTTQSTTPPIVASPEVVLEGISPASVTSLSYAPSAGQGTLTIQEGSTQQTLRLFGALAQSSFALSAASTASSPALALTITAPPTTPTLQVSGATSGATGIITNGNTLSVVGTAPLGTTVSVTANGTSSSQVTYSVQAGMGVETYSTTVAPTFASGSQVTLTATASNSAGSAAASETLAVDLLPPPVGNVTTSDDSSFDIAQILGNGYAFSFLSGTEAVQLTNGTLSVGPDTNQAVVERLYLGLLGRSADTGGLVAFSQQLASGVNVVSVANAMLGSAEYAARNGTPSNTAFVTQLYSNFLGRAPAQTELSGWLNTLAAGASRGLVASDFAISSEAKLHLAPSTANLWAPDPNGSLVVQLFDTGLGREPGQAETQAWVQQLQAGLSPQQFAQDVAASAEFGRDHNGQSPQAFVTSLYQSGLGRTPGSGELAGWVNQINAGATPAAILLGIGNSTEASARLSPGV